MGIAESYANLQRYAQAHDYAGHCKFDALNSPILERLFGFSHLSRLLVTQAVNRVPLPLRDVFRVTKQRNPKGIGNFIRGYANQYAVVPNAETLGEMTRLADWLCENDSASYDAYDGPGIGFGYQFPWENPNFYAPRHAPNVIVTVFAGEGLLAAFRATRNPRYLEVAKGVRDFVLRALPVLHEDSARRCIGYAPTGLNWCVINVNAVSAGFLAKLARETGDEEALTAARKQLAWTVSVRQPDFSWNYTHPKSQSGIGPDNYHTGGILDGIVDYQTASGDRRFETTYRESLDFYARHFFTEDGGPKWRVHRTFPMDVHGSAQGVISFAKASALEPGYLTTADRILNWAIQNLQDPEGYFYYQRLKHFTWKLNLMRWNNSWMFFAFSEHQLARQNQNQRAKSGVG